MKSQSEYERQYGGGAVVSESNLRNQSLSYLWDEKTREFLKTHKSAISFRWRGAKYGYYATDEETNAAWAEVLRSEGYVPPKWWQVSRWGEVKPPKEVLAALKEHEGAK